MKKLSLDKTWKECIRMWGWIAKCVHQPYNNVNTLKTKWLKANGYNWDEVKNTCFFCHHTINPVHALFLQYSDCDKCPGRKMEKGWACTERDNHYRNHPIRFYNDLCRLYKLRIKRLAKKRKRR